MVDGILAVSRFDAEAFHTVEIAVKKRTCSDIEHIVHDNQFGIGETVFPEGVQNQMNAFNFGFSADITEADNVFFPFGYLTQGAGNAVFVDEDVPTQSSFMQLGKIFAGRKQHIDF